MTYNKPPMPVGKHNWYCELCNENFDRRNKLHLIEMEGARYWFCHTCWTARMDEVPDDSGDWGSDEQFYGSSYHRLKEAGRV